MRPLLILILASTLLVAGSAGAWTHDISTQSRFVFDGSEQAHPKSVVIAVPIAEPIVGVDNAPLSFEAVFITLFRASDDERNGKGKVILKIEVIRDDVVVWKKRMKDKVKDDWATSRECGNCTHKLIACDAYDGELLPGDLVLFNFTFQDMPQFHGSDGSTVDTAIIGTPDRCG